MMTFRLTAKTCLTKKSADTIKMNNIFLFNIIMVFAQM